MRFSLTSMLLAVVQLALVVRASDDPYADLAGVISLTPDNYAKTTHKEQQLSIKAHTHFKQLTSNLIYMSFCETLFI